MIKSVRIHADLQARLTRAAKATQKSESEFIRDAVASQCDVVLSESAAEQLKDVIGIVSSEGGRADRSGDAFREILWARRRK